MFNFYTDTWIYLAGWLGVTFIAEVASSSSLCIALMKATEG